MADPRQFAELPHLLETFPEAVLMGSLNGRIAAANRAAARLTGRTPADLHDLQFRDLFPPHAHAVLLAHAQGAGNTVTLESEVLHATGSVLPVEIHAAIGEGGHAQLVVRETSARKRFEEAMRHSETRFRFMAKNLTEMVLAFDMQRRLTFVNEAFTTLTGYTGEELERERFINWVHPEDRPRMLGYWDRLFEGKSFTDEEYRLVTRDGRVKWVAASWGPILDDHGRQVGVQGREREVTERRMAEETLRQSEQRLRENEERYRTLFEDSPFPLWEEDFSRVKEYVAELEAQGVKDVRAHLIANRDAAMECLRRIRVLDINRAAREFYGATTKEEMLGSLEGVFDDAAWDTFCEEIAVLADTNSRYKADIAARTNDGEERTVSMIVSVEASPEDWSRVIVTFFDVTDRKRLEEQLLQSHKLESLGRLAGGIAHDFNNLLMVIIGYAELLLSGEEDAESVMAGLQEIKMAGERGAELTAQLLAFSRRQIAQPKSLSLNALIRESQGMLERVIGEDIQLNVLLASDAWNIKADRGQLHQVLMNLVVNAREAMPDGGSITILTANRRDGDPEADWLMLEVRDTGIGMDERTRRHVFEPFFTTKSPGKGTGLGMATVYGVVTQSGGHISVESAPGEGSVFRIHFPRHGAPLHIDVALPGSPAPAVRDGCVLVVEDQPEVRRVACAILQNLGFHVLEADSGEAALLAGEHHEGHIDVLLTDVIMPGMNGRELAEKFNRMRPRTKVIFMSGYTDRIMSEDGILDSSVHFLQKPFRPEDLSEVVGRVIGPPS